VSVGLSLFLFALLVYSVSPVHYLSDSRYSILMDEAILQHGTPDMRNYQVQRGHGLAFNKRGYWYTIDLVKGRLLYVYPWGGALLSLPAVAFSHAFRLKAAPRGVYKVSNELKIEAGTAAVLCAAIVVVVFETAILFLSCGWSLAIALAAGFGTPLWSSASRSLWSQTWYMVLISLFIWELVKEKPRPVLLGTLLAWVCFARPQASPIVPIVSLYVVVEFGLPVFLKYVAAGMAWGTVFAATMLFFFGRLLAPIYALSAARIDFQHGLLLRAEGLLFSPSRGLLVFVPIVLLPLYLTVRHWRDLRQRRLALLTLAVIVVHIVMTASWELWWGGWSYGPRMLMETIPWFVLLTILGLKAAAPRPAMIWTATALLALSVSLNAVGALSWSSKAWNAQPSIDAAPERAWDWKRPQFLAWMQP